MLSNACNLLSVLTLYECWGIISPPGCAAELRSHDICMTAGGLYHHLRVQLRWGHMIYIWLLRDYITTWVCSWDEVTWSMYDCWGIISPPGCAAEMRSHDLYMTAAGLYHHMGVQLRWGHMIYVWLLGNYITTWVCSWDEVTWSIYDCCGIISPHGCAAEMRSHDLCMTAGGLYHHLRVQLRWGHMIYVWLLGDYITTWVCSWDEVTWSMYDCWGIISPPGCVAKMRSHDLCMTAGGLYHHLGVQLRWGHMIHVWLLEDYITTWVCS